MSHASKVIFLFRSSFSFAGSKISVAVKTYETMAPLKELDVNRVNNRPSSQKKGSRKLLSKSPSMDGVPTLEEAALSMTEKLKRKRSSAEDERDDETVQETDLEPTQQPPESEQTPKKNDGGVDEAELDEPQLIRYDCNQVRTKINAYIRSGEMGVGEFQDRLGVGSTAYHRFMNQSGKNKGYESSVFNAAHNFFAVREDKGLKMPRAKKAKTTKDDKKDNTTKQAPKSTTSSTDKSKSKPKDKDLKGMDDKYDVSSMELDQETQGRVPVYDTCDDIRTKIRAHLRNTAQTQAAFGRMISHTYTLAGTSPDKPLNNANIKRFLDKHGPTAGNTSPVFYASYVYFEKLRVQAKKNKTKKRQEMEEAWGKDGVDVKNELGGPQGMLLHVSEQAYEDKLGKIHIVRDGHDSILH